jgi:hypothetical protein
MMQQFAASQATFHAVVLQRLSRLEDAVRVIAANQETLAKRVKKKSVHIDTKRNVFHDPPPSPVDMGSTAPPPPPPPQMGSENLIDCPVCHKAVPKQYATEHVNQHFEKPATNTKQNTHQQQNNVPTSATRRNTTSACTTPPVKANHICDQQEQRAAANSNNQCQNNANGQGGNWWQRIVPNVLNLK